MPDPIKAIADKLDEADRVEARMDDADREPKIVGGPPANRTERVVIEERMKTVPQFLPLSQRSLNLAHVLDVQPLQPTKGAFCLVVRYAFWDPLEQDLLTRRFNDPADVAAIAAAVGIRLPAATEDHR